GEQVAARTGRQAHVVRGEDVGRQRARREGVVDPERDVAGRVALGEHQLVGEGAAVAGRPDDEVVAGLLLELLDHRARRRRGWRAACRSGLITGFGSANESWVTRTTFVVPSSVLSPEPTSEQPPR